MKSRTVQALLGLVVACLITQASGQMPAQDVTAAMQGELATQVLEGCNSEFTRYCAEVTPGEGRLLACLYAYEDKLSGQCEHALYDAAARLERAIGAITYVANECRAELETHCAGVEVGDGRVAQCLKDHAAELSPGCDRALIAVAIDPTSTALPETVKMLVVRIAAGDTTPWWRATAAGSSADAAALVGATWVAEDIQSRGVVDYLQSSLTLEADGQVHGFGGCNDFTGRYTLEEEALTLEPQAGHRKGCPPAIMNQETRFHEALGETRTFRFEKTLLFLLDAQGVSVMRLWRRN